MVVAKIGIPGAVGAFAGATFLSSLSTETAAPVMSVILLALGLYVLLRFTIAGLPKGNLGKPLRKRFLAPLGVVGGFVDATGGGGWGPVGTPAILASGRLEPRKTIGSIDTSEFLVAVAASLGFIFGIGGEGVNYTWVLALLVGGMIAAPDRGLAGPAHPAARPGLARRRRDHPHQRAARCSERLDRRRRRHRNLSTPSSPSLWAPALAYSFNEYRKHRDEEQRIIAEAESALSRPAQVA